MDERAMNLAPAGRLAHPFPCQGSKRRLAPRILPFVPADTQTLFEPFAGSAAVTVDPAVARVHRAQHLVLSDIHEPLVRSADAGLVAAAPDHRRSKPSSWRSPQPG